MVQRQESRYVTVKCCSRTMYQKWVAAPFTVVSLQQIYRDVQEKQLKLFLNECNCRMSCPNQQNRWTAYYRHSSRQKAAFCWQPTLEAAYKVTFHFWCWPRVSTAARQFWDGFFVLFLSCQVFKPDSKWRLYDIQQEHNAGWSAMRSTCDEFMTEHPWSNHVEPGRDVLETAQSMLTQTLCLYVWARNVNEKWNALNQPVQCSVTWKTKTFVVVNNFQTWRCWFSLSEAVSHGREVAVLTFHLRWWTTNVWAGFEYAWHRGKLSEAAAVLLAAKLLAGPET